MFDKLSKMKDLYALKKQADQMKKEMEKILVQVFVGDFEISMKGDQTVEYVKENGEERSDLKNLFNNIIISPK